MYLLLASLVGQLHRGNKYILAHILANEYTMNQLPRTEGTLYIILEAMGIVQII